MKDRQGQHTASGKEFLQSDSAVSGERKDWEDPRLSFVEPKLTERGSVKDLTGGFFGTFAP